MFLTRKPKFLYSQAQQLSGSSDALSTEKEPLRDSSEESVDTQQDAESLMKSLGLRYRAPKASRWWWYCSLTANALLLGLSGILAIYAWRCSSLTERFCTEKLSAFSPAFDSVEYEYVKFQGGLAETNPYKGYPSEHRDAAWEDIVNLGRVRVSPSDFEKLDKPKTSVSYPSGEYQGGLEVFHQLHCLNFIRQSTYLDYYELPEHRPESFHDSAPTRRLHLDHCIDMLRQTITCYGDVGIVTNDWVEGYPSPYPDFSTWHKCRKLEPLLAYTNNNAGPVEFSMPDDAYVMPEPPR